MDRLHFRENRFRMDSLALAYSFTSVNVCSVTIRFGGAVYILI